ncbi:baseplate J/gp47 family protein [Aminipila terrae]|uniref:Baseplate J protein n=1 Tax=Aminipila terrae TaxID=2697030 RepID=A0A6P1MQ46_9FIRM|nr:baseplate J/gp47 family protein [Aminipila terrae]QHI73776.1 baseplate J protein [Aminipila terrae]
MSIIIKNQDNIYTDLLSNIPDDYEKSTGTLTADLAKSNAIEMAKVYEVVGQLIKLVDVDNLAGEELTKYVLQRKGISRKTATYAQVVLNITGTGNVAVGDLFATASNTQFKSLESKAITGNGTIRAQAVVAGATGNVGANTIISMPITITGITAVNNPAASYDGYDEETDNSLKSRYYEALQKPATSGNIYHYLEWAKSINGCGNAKVIPLWNGANTVKIVIINSDMQVASQTIIDAVQNYIDPKGTNNSTWGTGKGEAPIGAYCTVVSAAGVNINISVDATLSSGYTLETVTTNIKNNITAYLKSIAFEQDYVSYAKIGSIILDTEGVKDYTTLTVNGGMTSINVGNEEVAVMGSVVVE